MNYLFFDTECANQFDNLSKMCSFGYVLTDDKFNILETDDIIMHPESKWDYRVLKKILFYKRNYYESFPAFPKHYERIMKLIDGAIIFGHAIRNDVINLDDALDRYDLAKPEFKFYDTQRIYMGYKGITQNEPSLEAVALDLNIEEQNQKHTSIQDARISMLALKKLMEESGKSLEELAKLAPNIEGSYSKGEISKFQSATLNQPPRNNHPLHGANFQTYTYLVENQNIVEGPLSGKAIAISNNYEENHFIELLSIINCINSLGGKYVRKVNECNIFIPFTYILQDGKEKPDMKLNDVDKLIDAGKVIEKQTLEELLSNIGYNENEVLGYYFKLKEAQIEIHHKEMIAKRAKALKEDKESRRPEEEFSYSLGDLLKEIL